MHLLKKTSFLASASALALVFSIDGRGLDLGSTVFAQGVSEIVVTARKREENLFDIPISVSAFSQGNIDALGVNTIGDLSKFTPGFDFQDVGQGGVSGRQSPNIRFRGVGVQNENPASRAGAVFWDGAYLSAGAGILPLFDLERVEIIKGPQNAFYGRNTFAGAVNFIPATAGDELEGKLNVKFSPSQQDSVEVNGAISVPVGDKIGLRLGAFLERVGADYEFANGDPLGEEETAAVSGAVTWDITESFRVKVTGFYVSSEDTRSTSSQDFTTAPGDCNIVYEGQLRDVATGELGAPFSTDLSLSPRGTFCGNIPDWDASGFNTTAFGKFEPGVPLDGFSGPVEFATTLASELQGFTFPDAPKGFGTTYRLWRTNVSAEYDLPADHTLSALISQGTSASWNIIDQLYGQSPTGVARLTGFQNWIRDRYAQIRLASGSENRLRYQVGFSYYKNKVRNADIPPFAGFAFAVPTLDDNNLSFIDGESIGIFGSVDFDILENLTISVEGRYADDTQTIAYDGRSQRDGPVLDAVIGEEQNFSKFMPRVLLSYQPTPDINIYASWALSYLQGNDTNAADYAIQVPDAGLNPDTLGFFTPVQKLTAYEIGVKKQLFENLNSSFAFYYMDWKDQVQFELSPNFTALYTAGDSEYWGIETEINWNPIEWLNLNGNMSYTNAEFTDFAGAGSVAGQILFPGLPPGQQISAIGNRPRYIPEWTAAMSATVQLDRLFDLPVPMFIRADANYTGQFFLDNFEYNSVEGYWKANMRAGVEVNENLAIEFYGTNLTDDQSWSTGGGGTTTGSGDFGFATRKTFGIIPPRREFGFQARLKF